MVFDTRLPAGGLPVRLLDVGGFDASGRSQGLLFDQEEQQKYRQLDLAG